MFMSAATKESLKSIVDEFGDHFTRHTTVDELRSVFSRVRASGCCVLHLSVCYKCQLGYCGECW